MIREGDLIAEEIMYKKYGIIIAKKIKDFNLLNDFDDYFQESLLVLSKSIDTYIDNEIGFYPYFHRNLTNKLISIKRKNSSQKVLDVCTNDFVLELKDPGSIISYDFQENKIFKGLSKGEINLINLKYRDKMTIKEIAVELGITKSKTFYYLSKARDKIKKNCVDSDDNY